MIPVYNEETDLPRCVRRLHAHLTSAFPYPFRITIADNASTDRTLAVAARARRDDLPSVRVVHLPQKGRGRALRAVWSPRDAPVLAYMDVDLSTDLDGAAPAGRAAGLRALRPRDRHPARPRRRGWSAGPKREFISRCYNLILRRRCGPGSATRSAGSRRSARDVARQLLPLVEDNGVVLRHRAAGARRARGLRIHEVPVDWVDDPDSRVDIVATAMADLRGVARMLGGLRDRADPGFDGSGPVSDTRRSRQPRARRPPDRPDGDATAARPAPTSRSERSDSASGTPTLQTQRRRRARKDQAGRVEANSAGLSSDGHAVVVGHLARGVAQLLDQRRQVAVEPLLHPLQGIELDGEVAAPIRRGRRAPRAAPA